MLTDFPKVTVGILAYNHEDFIEACLHSIVQQTYPNFDIIVTDDVSKDDTVRRIQAVQARYPERRIRLIANEKNLGIAPNANQILDQAEGTYICLFSGDDLMYPDRLMRQVAFMEANPDVGLCFTNMEWFWSDTGRTLCRHFGWLQRPSTSLADVISDFTIPTPTAMLRASSLGGLRYDGSYPFLNDSVFMISLLQRTKAAYLPACLIRYRKHRGSATWTRMFVDERKRFLAALRQTLPDEYAPALTRYEKLVTYATLRENLRAGQPLDWKNFAGLCLMAFVSPKWGLRLLSILGDAVRPNRATGQ